MRKIPDLEYRDLTINCTYNLYFLKIFPLDTISVDKKCMQNNDSKHTFSLELHVYLAVPDNKKQSNIPLVCLNTCIKVKVIKLRYPNGPPPNPIILHPLPACKYIFFYSEQYSYKYLLFDLN